MPSMTGSDKLSHFGKIGPGRCRVARTERCTRKGWVVFDPLIFYKCRINLEELGPKG